jgi:hypothetical protein
MRNFIFGFMMLTFIQSAYARLLVPCYDKYGCPGCAGYSWCEETQECVRWWENPCNTSDYLDYLIGNNDI